MKKENVKPTKTEIDTIKTAQPERVINNKLIIAEITEQKKNGDVKIWRKYEDNTESDE